MRPSLPLLLLAGCDRTTIEGEVLTLAGAPARGAQVSALAAECAAIVGEDGRFSMPCTAGEHLLRIHREGAIEQQERVRALPGEALDIGRRVLVTEPPAPGLFLVDGEALRDLPPAWLARTVQDGRVRTRRYCLTRQDSATTSLAAGEHTLLDNQAPGWRPFRLDEEGCAYRDQRDDRARWVVTWKQVAPVEERALDAERALARLRLDPGDYFIATWDQGFFTPDPVDPDRFAGHWLHVEG